MKMKPQKALLVQTGRIAAGVAALVALMLAIFAVAGQFSIPALLGGIYTGALTVVNFFVMGLTVQDITDKVGERQRSEEEIESLSKQMKARMQSSYTLRMIVLMGLVAVGIAVFHFDALAAILPLLFPRVAIGVLQLIDQRASKGSEKS